MIWLKRSLAAYDVRIETGAKVSSIDMSGSVIVIRENKPESLGIFDTIIMASGVRPHQPLGEDLREHVPEIYVVGDAYAICTNGMDALHHAAEISRRI